jgi:type I restriction enzyme S subunit
MLSRISNAMAHADRLEAEAGRAQALLDRLEAAILTKAFKGKLVPQDPNEEAASMLLERIRAQRVAAAPTWKTKRGKRFSSVVGQPYW